MISRIYTRTKGENTEREEEMNDFELKMTTGEISTNLGDLRTELSEIADKYKGIVIKEIDIPLAKKDLAELRKIRKSVDDRRKEIKSEWQKPYLAFAKEVKDALAIIDKPIGQIDSMLKDFEVQRKHEKELHCREIFDDAVGDLGEYLTFDRCFKESWLNKSTEDNEILSDISGERLKVNNDLEVIRTLKSEFEEEVLKVYKESGCQLAAAIQRNQQLTSAKELAEKRAEEQAKEKELAKKRAEEQAKEKEPAVEPMPETYRLTFTIRVYDKAIADELQAYLRMNDITDYSITY